MDAEARGLSDTLVLCYHALSEDWPAALSTTPERFAAQLAILARRGYRGVTFAEIASGTVRGKAVAVTFDDGYRSVLEQAKPLLDRHGWPASLYVPTDWVGRDAPMTWAGIDRWIGGEHERELLPLAWDDLRGLANEGWEIGAHTKSHPHLTELGDAELRAELEGSRAATAEGLGRECTTIAYPYGDVDDRVERAAGAAGYTAAAALPRRQHEARPLRWPRVGIYHHDDERRFMLKTSALGRRLQRTLPGGGV